MTTINGMSLRAILLPPAAVALAVLAGLAGTGLFSHANLSLVFLTAVLVVASLTGPGAALIASILSFLAFNYFFTSPELTLAVDAREDVVTLLFFLLFAAIGGQLAARMRREVNKSRAGLWRLSLLHESGRRMSAAVDQDTVLQALAAQLHGAGIRPFAIVAPDADGEPLRKSAVESGADLPAPDLLRDYMAGGMGTQTLADGRQCHRVGTHAGTAALVILAPPVDEETRLLIGGLLDQASLAVDRIRLGADLNAAQLAAETEQLRSALLSSVSHDLRTPLAAIIGAGSSLTDDGEAFSRDNRQELAQTIVAEARRLDRYIQNLLDMTRLGQGGLVLERDWVDARDLIASAVNRIGSLGTVLPVIQMRIEADVPLLWVHGVLVEQALFNLLENAVQHCRTEDTITIDVRLHDAQVRIAVIDTGPGIPVQDREKVFDMFYSLRRGDRTADQGTGLGLAICRGLIGAHGGRVSAHDGPGGTGTEMRICLPTGQGPA